MMKGLLRNPTYFVEEQVLEPPNDTDSKNSTDNDEESQNDENDDTLVWKLDSTCFWKQTIIPVKV